MKRRVVITGVGLVSPLGSTQSELTENILLGKSGIKFMPEWEDAPGLSTRVAAPVEGFDGSSIPRHQRRSMSRVSQMATMATQSAIEDSRLTTEMVQDKSTGIAYGSLMGGMSAIEGYFKNIEKTGSYVTGMQSNAFLQMMSHTTAANLAMAFGISGRLISSCVACSASSQSIGFAYELIRDGQMNRMICGGGEELHLGTVGCFDVLRATSRNFAATPESSCRPFSKDRDGIVCSEGAGTLILEDYDSAKSRGAKICGEVLGFHTCTDTSHMTNPSQEAMEEVMAKALENAGVDSTNISYVNAHATGTEVGDRAESKAISSVLGNTVPVSSLKGHFGHLMGASGVVEIIATLGMMQKQTLPPNRNYAGKDDSCADIRLLTDLGTKPRGNVFLKNTFAFGGINVSLVIENKIIN